MAPGFSALRDERVGTCRNGLTGMRQRLNLADQWNAAAFDPLDECCERAERQHQGCGSARQQKIKQFRFGCERPGDEAASDAHITGLAELARQPFAVAVAVAATYEA